MRTFNKKASTITMIITFLLISLKHTISYSAYLYNNRCPAKISTSINDTIITAHVKTMLYNSKNLQAYSIKVNTKNGIVYLEGVVDTIAQYEEAIALAEAVDHVIDVNVTHLKVKNHNNYKALYDAYITAKVKGVLIKAALNQATIHIKTRDGIVYFFGWVNNQQQIDNTIKSAQSVRGIKFIRSSLKIQNSKYSMNS